MLNNCGGGIGSPLRTFSGWPRTFLRIFPTRVRQFPSPKSVGYECTGVEAFLPKLLTSYLMFRVDPVIPQASGLSTKYNH